MSQFVLKNATVILVYDAEAGSQGMLAISPSGGMWLQGPPNGGATAREFTLTELRAFFTSNEHSLDVVAPVALAAIDEKEAKPS